MVLDPGTFDSELQASNNAASGSPSIEMPPRPQWSQRIDYHLLNGGSDEDDIDISERNPDWIRHWTA